MSDTTPRTSPDSRWRGPYESLSQVGRQRTRPASAAGRSGYQWAGHRQMLRPDDRPIASAPSKVAASADGRTIVVSDVSAEDLSDAENDAYLIESARQVLACAQATLALPEGKVSACEWRGTAKLLVRALNDVVDIAMTR